MVDGDDALRAVAARHGLSQAAVAALREALRSGGGGMAQFSHPDLGGMGQWSSGGMVQIGDMFNDRLRAQVGAACADLAEAIRAERAAPEPAGPAPLRDGTGPRWPGELGQPSAAGSQNGLRYAYFAERRRLAIARDGRMTLYDTGLHRIFGVSQRQSRGPHLAFTAEDGTVDLDALAVVTA